MSENLTYYHSENLLADSQRIIEAAQRTAYQTVDQVLVLRNWLLGKRISECNMDGDRKDRYGEKIIAQLSEQLTNQYGKGFDKRALYRFVKFYRLYPEIAATVSPQSFDGDDSRIAATASPQSSGRGVVLS